MEVLEWSWRGNSPRGEMAESETVLRELIACDNVLADVIN